MAQSGFPCLEEGPGPRALDIMDMIPLLPLFLPRSQAETMGPPAAVCAVAGLPQESRATEPELLSLFRHHHAALFAGGGRVEIQQDSL